VAAQLEAERKALDDLRLRLKPTHPDVLRQQRIVAELQKKAADETAVLALVPQGTTQAPANPVEVARLNRIAQIRAEIDALVREIGRKEQDEARLRNEVSDYQARIESAPARESELTELMRDYDTLEKSYTTLLSKKEEAQVAANLERRQIGEQFKILDPARLPERPISPNRPLLYTAGAAAGLGFGILLAAFLELRDTSLKNDGDVVAQLALPVLAAIPELMTNEARRSRARRQRVVSWATAGAVGFVMAVLVWAWRF
jgi:uncharacterized protein involved in exopolysaccharide biosynthesis